MTSVPLGAESGPSAAHAPGLRAEGTDMHGAERGHRRAGLFPVVTGPLSPECRDGLNRRQVRRLARDVQATADALNWLHGEPRRPPASRLDSDAQKCSRLQQLTQQRLESSCLRWMNDGSAFEPEEAFRSLLKGRSPYGEAGSASLAPFSDSRLSLPERVGDGPFVEDCCAEEVSILLKDFEHRMLRPREEVEAMARIRGTVGCHVDPVLRHNQKVYAKLVKRSLACGLTSLTLQCRCEIGLFFVWKKTRKYVSSSTVVVPTSISMTRPASNS
jgi:hypothetical protein